MVERKKRVETERQRARRKAREASPKGKEIRKRIEKRRREKEKVGLARLQVLEEAERAGTLVVLPPEKKKLRKSWAAYKAELKRFAPARKRFWEKRGFLEEESDLLAESGLPVGGRARGRERRKKGYSTITLILKNRRTKLRRLRVVEKLSEEEIARLLRRELLRYGGDVGDFIKSFYP